MRSVVPYAGGMRTRRVTVALGVALALVAVSCAGSSHETSPTTTTTGAAAPPTSAAESLTVGPVAPPVPAAFASLARELGVRLDQFASRADTGTDTAGDTSGGPVMGAHLTVANGNRGPALLAPATLDAVDRFLDRFSQLGLRGVTITIPFPLLLPSTPDASRYLAFYEAVAQRVRARHMTFAVEQNAVFRNTVFSPLHPDYAGLTLDRYAAEQRQMAQTIVDRVAPDYLALLGEPDTFAHNLGLPALDDPATAARVVGVELAGLRRGRTSVGAGTGTWSDPAFVRLLLERTAIDYVSLHVYPVTPATTANLEEQIGLARRARKPVIIDEAWLYKAGASDRLGATSNVAAAPEIFRRDSFSFWQPLDSRFLDLVTRYARAHGVVYLSPFWTGLFFGYVDYGPADANAAYGEIAREVNRVQYANVLAGRITQTGETYAMLAGKTSR